MTMSEQRKPGESQKEPEKLEFKKFAVARCRSTRLESGKRIVSRRRALESQLELSAILRSGSTRLYPA